MKQSLGKQSVLDLGEVLSGALSPATGSRLRSDGVSLAGIAAAALRNQVRGAVWLELCRHGICMPLPEVLRARLPEGHSALVLEDGWRHESERTRNLTGQASDIIAALNDAGITPMLLKGMALVLGGTMPEPGRRWMVDIDFMVRPEELDIAMATLDRLGYCHRAERGAPHHAPSVTRAPGEAEIEVHFAMVVPALQPALPAEAAWAEARLHDEGGLRFYCPSPEDALMHAALHGQESKCVRQLARIPFRALADFAALRERHAQTVDWPALRRRAAAAGCAASFDTHLYQACLLFRQDWPLPRRAKLAVRLHWRLCLIAAAHPRSVGQALFTWLEIRQLASTAAKGRGPVGGAVACLALAVRLAFKYRGRLAARLMGKRK